MMTQMNEKLPMKPNNDFLCHHGVKDQKWGTRRYQNKDGSLTPLGRIHWGIGPERKAAIKKKFTLAKDNVKKLALKAKTKHEENLKLRKEKQEQSIANKKAKLISKGDPAEIHKNRALFSDAELDQAMNRIKKLQELKSMDPKQKEAVQKLEQTQKNRKVVKDGKSTVDKIVDGVATAVSIYTAYNKLAGMVNAISGKETMKAFSLKPWETKKDNKDNEDGSDSGNQNQGEPKKPKDRSGNQNQSNQNKSNTASGNQNQGGQTNPATGNWNLKALGNQTTTTSSIVRKDGYQTTSKDTDLWNDISLSPSSWTSSSAVGSTDSYSMSDAKLKRSSQKSQTIFDMNNGYLSKDDLKTISKQGTSKDEHKKAEFVTPLMSLYSGQEKAKDVSFKDLAADYTKTEYTGRTRTSGDELGYSIDNSTDPGANVTKWERITTRVAPKTVTVGSSDVSISDYGGSYKKTDWEDVGYSISDISKTNANRSAARTSFVNDIIKSGTTTLDMYQQDRANVIGLGQDYVNDLFDAMKGK